MKRLIVHSLTLMLCLSALAPSSPASQMVQNEQAWETYSGKGENFTVSFPAQPTATITYRPVRVIVSREAEKYRGTLYNSYSDGIAYLLYSFPHHQEPLKQFIDELAGRFTAMKVVSESDVTAEGVSGRRYLIKFRDLDGVIDCYVTDNRAYILEAVGGDENSPSVKRFLESFTLTKASASTVIEIKPGKPSQAEPQTDSGPAFMAKEVDRKAVIILRREPQYSEEARQRLVSGNIVIRAVLSSSGKVTNIEVVKSLPSGLEEKAVEAARQIIFIPAMKDGKFVSQTVQLEYGFSVY